MANHSHTTAATIGKAADLITSLAQEVQNRAACIQHLLEAIDEASDEFTDLSDLREEAGRKRRAAALDRMILFGQLAREAAGRASAAGEEIERCGSRLNMRTELRPPAHS